MSKTMTRCACTHGPLEHLRAYPSERDSLRKDVYTECGKAFWTNDETERCFDCEAKTRPGSTEVTNN